MGLDRGFLRFEDYALSPGGIAGSMLYGRAFGWLLGKLVLEDVPWSRRAGDLRPSRGNRSHWVIDGTTMSDGVSETQIGPLANYIERIQELRMDVSNNTAENRGVRGLLTPHGDRVAEPCLMVIGRVGLAELATPLRRAKRRLGRAINITSYDEEEFDKKAAAGHHFVTTVLAALQGDAGELVKTSGKWAGQAS